MPFGARIRQLLSGLRDEQPSERATPPPEHYDTVPRGRREPFSTPEYEILPRGRQEPFSSVEYDVLPRGRYAYARKDYYSPIPDLETLPEDIWTRTSGLQGLKLDAGKSIAFLERELAGFVRELDVPRDYPGEPGMFFVENQNFESVDAELLYAMVRWAKPATVLELGSGFSSLLINMAARRNAEDGIETRHVANDPYPRASILGEALKDPPTRFEQRGATEVPLAAFEALVPGDVLFVDTTHTVKVGSDVNFIVLEALPRLEPGVIVHFHDIFLPAEYPRVWFSDSGYYWNEQYLLQAFLAFNEAFEILLPAHAVSREHPDRLAAVVPTFGPGVSPASMWLRRRD